MLTLGRDCMLVGCNISKCKREDAGMGVYGYLSGLSWLCMLAGTRDEEASGAAFPRKVLVDATTTEERYDQS